MLSMIPSMLRGVDVRDLETLKAITRHAFPAVSQVSSSTLADWMQMARTILLVDVRSPEEFAISHLRNAIHLQSADRITEAIKDRKPTKTVLYCAVGFRSSRMSDRLARQGLTEIMNLEGSIFQWANEGRPIYRGDLPVQTVHPYGKLWAGLLKPGISGRSSA